MSRPLVRTLLLASACAALIGCTSLPSPDDAPAATARPAARADAAGTSQGAYEQKQRERAQTFVRQRRWADAAIAWELLTVLRPDVAEYRERLAESQRQIDAGVAERLPRAAQAVQRGDLDAAAQLYLGALALQPLNETAGEGMRAVERERNKRGYLGKFSRYTLTRRAMADAEMPATLAGMAGRNEVEHAALLAGDGEFDDAIGLLERRIAVERQDAAARHLLADVYYRKAESLLPRDKAGAVAALQKSARTDPSDGRAAARLKQLQASGPAPAGANPAR